MLLLIDDDQDLTALLSHLLEHKGYQVQVAPDRARAEAILHGSAPPEIVLLDRMLPDGDGIQILEEMRRDGPLRDVPVIVVTAKASRADVEKALADGASDYVVKPFKAQDLLHRIESLVAAARPLPPASKAAAAVAASVPLPAAPAPTPRSTAVETPTAVIPARPPAAAAAAALAPPPPAVGAAAAPAPVVRAPPPSPVPPATPAAPAARPRRVAVRAARPAPTIPAPSFETRPVASAPAPPAPALPPAAPIASPAPPTPTAPVTTSPTAPPAPPKPSPGRLPRAARPPVVAREREDHWEAPPLFRDLRGRPLARPAAAPREERWEAPPLFRDLRGRPLAGPAPAPRAEHWEAPELFRELPARPLAEEKPAPLPSLIAAALPSGPALEVYQELWSRTPRVRQRSPVGLVANELFRRLSGRPVREPAPAPAPAVTPVQAPAGPAVPSPAARAPSPVPALRAPTPAPRFRGRAFEVGETIFELPPGPLFEVQEERWSRVPKARARSTPELAASELFRSMPTRPLLEPRPRPAAPPAPLAARPRGPLFELEESVPEAPAGPLFETRETLFAMPPGPVLELFDERWSRVPRVRLRRVEGLQATDLFARLPGRPLLEPAPLPAPITRHEEPLRAVVHVRRGAHVVAPGTPLLELEELLVAHEPGPGPEGLLPSAKLIPVHLVAPRRVARRPLDRISPKPPLAAIRVHVGRTSKAVEGHRVAVRAPAPGEAHRVAIRAPAVPEAHRVAIRSTTHPAAPAAKATAVPSPSVAQAIPPQLGPRDRRARREGSADRGAAPVAVDARSPTSCARRAGRSPAGRRALHFQARPLRARHPRAGRRASSRRRVFDAAGPREREPRRARVRPLRDPRRWGRGRRDGPRAARLRGQGRRPVRPRFGRKDAPPGPPRAHSARGGL